MDEKISARQEELPTKRLAAAAVDALLIASIDTAIFRYYCYEILIAQGARQFHLQALPFTIFADATSICATWFALTFWDAFAVVPAILAFFIALEMNNLSGAVKFRIPIRLGHCL